MHLFLTPLPVSVGKLWQGRAIRGLGPSRGTATLGAGMSKATAQGSQRELSRHHPQCKAHPKNGLGMTVAHTNTQGRHTMANLMQDIRLPWQWEMFSLPENRHRFQREFRLPHITQGAQVRFEKSRNAVLEKSYLTEPGRQRPLCRSEHSLIISLPRRKVQNIHGWRPWPWEMEEKSTKTELTLR